MSLSEAYIRKIEYLIENLPKRLYQPVSECSFDAFFTFDRLSLIDAKQHKREKILPKTSWGKKWEYGWFFTTVKLPETCTGKRICFCAELGECLVYVNEKIYGALDKKHKEITLTKSAKGGEIYEIAMEVYAGHDGLEDCLDQIHRKIIIPETPITEFPDDVNQKVVKNGNVVICNEEVFQCLMDIETLYDLRNNLDADMLRRALIDKTLKKVCDTIDIELELNEFLKTVTASRELMREALSCKNGSSAPVVYAIGNSHLDLEWLWTKNETKRKIARTLGNQLKLIEEYEDYVYIQSQPWLLEVVKNDYPDLYLDVKNAVKNGKIVVEGGMWVESDTNIPSGESLIRQFMFGKKFIKEEFEVESVMFWLPDSFGCSASLPQIMDKCGIKYFMNAKIKWLYDGGDDFPYSNFIWKGIDGTKIQSFVTRDYAAGTNPSKIFEKWNMNNEKEDVPAIMFPFGHGDGGGGATRVHTEFLKREKDLEGLPKVVCKSPIEFYDYVNECCEVNNEYVGELYFAAHRGSYTTQAFTKKMNRRCELALREAEIWTALNGSKRELKAEIDCMWKKLLFNQFHDIIPGTSITQVYENTAKDYREILDSASNITQNALKEFTDKKDNCITVFNSLSWVRNVFVELPDGFNAVSDMEGNKMNTQRIGDKIVTQVTVPSLGMKSFRVYKDGETNYVDSVKDEYVLENSCLVAKFNEKGELVSLISKDTSKEFLSGPSNRFRLYKDMPLLFDAWDIDEFYKNQEIDLDCETDVELECNGDLMSVLKVKKRINNSYIIQRAILRKDECKVDFETEIDWRETHKLLKVDFDTNIQTNELISEIQFGHIKRPNHKSRQHDADRFEVCQHKWSALAESNRGVAILNDCKYGVSAEDNTISLTLLKAATAPSLTADKGNHKFVYSVMPFSESLSESNVVRASYELNCLAYVECGYADERSLIEISNSNIIADTIKQSEDNDGIVMRLYESTGSACDVSVSFGFDAEKVYQTDMTENIISDIEVKDRNIQMSFKPFEVITIKIVKK